jgi:hypothetical protein
LTGCQFAWADKDDGTGWEIELFWTWTALNGNGGIYEFIPGISKRITIAMAVNDADELPEREHMLFWWREYGTCSAASEHAMFRLVGPVTGIYGHEKAGLSVYPNPVNQILFITSDESIRQAQIINLLGQVVQTCRFTYGNSIQVGGLPAGVYLIAVETASNRIITIRFLKN